MHSESVTALKETSSIAISHLARIFDKIATWVAQLSWWKFLLFAALTITAGGILQDILFSSDQDVIFIEKKKQKKHSTEALKAAKRDADVQIDGNGVRIKTYTYTDDTQDAASAPIAPAPAPATPNTPAASTTPSPAANAAGVHLTVPLPPDAARDVNTAIDEAVNAIDEAADDKAEQKVAHYQKKSSQWFENFVFLLVLGLFGTKALMGGKKRAEALARTANAAAEHANLQRQVSEAKIQMIQAQVEPHFLFNTLASVEYLIETDPPRASAMQKRLIQYLRAVLPQMRETATVTNLGRETDIVRAYLDLLKMRMEERLNVDIQVTDGLRSAAFPPMMLQSLVENAIKHGLECKTEGGTLRILAEVADNKLRVSVADDGLGFGAVPSNGTGLGLQSIRDRLKLLHGDQAQLIIAPNSPSGVCATIEVPYQLAGRNNAQAA